MTYGTTVPYSAPSPGPQDSHPARTRLDGGDETGDADGIALVGANVLAGFVLLAIDEVIAGSHVEIEDIDAGGGVPDANEFGGARVG